MIKEAIVKIVNKEDLTYDEAYTVMNEIMNGETSPTQNAAFLAALSTKSAKAETKDEISLLFIYLAALGLSFGTQYLCCIMQDLSLWHAGLVPLQHVESLFPDQGSNLHPQHCKADS